MMIGDNMQTDIKGAMAAGLDTILFNRWDYDIKRETLRPPLT
jgi:putative hydrolase of the HAD superfamily